jgi:hypothetical protein
MQFVILINDDEKAAANASAAQKQEVYGAYMKYTQDLQAAGVMKGGEALEPSATGAARISIKAGKRTVLDGPFAEAKEVVGGFYLIDVKSREEAIEWAAKCPGASTGSVEVRQVMSFAK